MTYIDLSSSNVASEAIPGSIFSPPVAGVVGNLWQIERYKRDGMARWNEERNHLDLDHDFDLMGKFPNQESVPQRPSKFLYLRNLTLGYIGNCPASVKIEPVLHTIRKLKQ